MPSCSLQDMQQNAVDALDRLKEAAGIPIILNSAYRSPAWEKARGRSGTGAHSIGMAFDVRCVDDAARFKILKAAIQTGCARIGVAKSYMHIDFSRTHSQNVAWMY